MAEKKYVVPQEMLMAAAKAYNAETMNLGYKYVIDRNVIEAAVTAAIQWLAENPIVPTLEQVTGLVAKWNDRQGTFLTYEMAAKVIAMEWQRRMFLAPESGFPEGMKRLIRESVSNADEIRLLRAYELGKEEGVKNGRV